MPGLIDSLFDVPCRALYRKTSDSKRRFSNPNAPARVARPGDPATLADLPTAYDALWTRLSDPAYVKFGQARAAAAAEQPSAAANLLAEVNFGGLAVAIGADLGDGTRLGAIAICGEADLVANFVVEFNSYAEEMPDDGGAIVLFRYHDDDEALAGLPIMSVPKDTAPGDGITVGLSNDFYTPPSLTSISATDELRLIELAEIERLAEASGVPLIWWGTPAKPVKKTRKPREQSVKTTPTAAPSDEPELPFGNPDTTPATTLVDVERVAEAIYEANRALRVDRAWQEQKPPPPVWSEITPSAREYVMRQAEAAVTVMVKQVFPNASSQEEGRT